MNRFEINSNASGYPDSNVINGVSAHCSLFDSIEEFNSALENGDDIRIFRNRAGQQFYADMGLTTKLLTVDNFVNDSGANVGYINLDEIQEMIVYEIKKTSCEDEILDIFKDYRNALETLRDCPDNQTTIIFGHISNCDNIDNEMVRYNVDVYTYNLGIYEPYEPYKNS